MALNGGAPGAAVPGLLPQVHPSARFESHLQRSARENGRARLEQGGAAV